jgi:hypothetical protein
MEPSFLEAIDDALVEQDNVLAGKDVLIEAGGKRMINEIV